MMRLFLCVLVLFLAACQSELNYSEAPNQLEKTAYGGYRSLSWDNSGRIYFAFSPDYVQFRGIHIKSGSRTRESATKYEKLNLIFREYDSLVNVIIEYKDKDPEINRYWLGNLTPKDANELQVFLKKNSTQLNIIWQTKKSS